MKRIGKTTPAATDNPNIIVDENTGQIIYTYDNVDPVPNPVIVPNNPVIVPNNPDILPDTDSFAVVFDSTLKDLPVHIKCTWVKAFTRPMNDKGLCIRSYDRTILNGSDVIGTATGNYCIPNVSSIRGLGNTWIEVTLLKCDRRSTGWVNNEHVIAKTGRVILPPAPPPVNPDIPTPPPGPGEVPAKNNGWIAWLTGAVTLLSFLR